jgi:predicted  nucleic acid-binding Zn-ribbon protein
MISYNVDYNHCLAQSARLAELEAKIVDTKVKLARLRQQHPPASRMTAPRAEATAERQTNELVSLQGQIDAGHERAEEYAAQREKKKHDAASAAAKRAEVERELKARRRAIKEAGQAEDARIGELVEWFVLEDCRRLYLPFTRLLQERSDTPTPRSACVRNCP